MVNDISQQGVDFSKSWEKWEPKEYLDIAGRRTIGWGHLIRPGEEFDGLLEVYQGNVMFAADMRHIAVAPVLHLFGDTLEQPQFDALCDFAFNEGSGALATSHLAALIKTGQYEPEQILAEFERWRFVHVDGKPVESAGLLARRRAEADIFLNGNYVNHA